MNMPPSWFSFPTWSIQLLTLGLVLLAGIADALIPLGVAVGVFYVLPIIATVPLAKPKVTRLVAISVTGLIVIVYWIFAEEGTSWMVVTNRAISIIAVWGTCFVTIQAILAFEVSEALRHNIELDQQKQMEELERKQQALLNLLEDFDQAQKRIKESQERFDLAIKGTNDGIWDWLDVSQDAQWWSPQLYRLLGYQPDEVTPCLSKFKEILHPDDRESTFQLVQDHFEKNVPIDIEYRLQTKSGEYRWFHGLATTVRDEDDRPVRMTGSIRDITVRKEAEDAFFGLNRRNSLILSSAGEGIYGLDLQGRSTFVNPVAATMFGYESDECIGRSMHEIIHNGHHDGSSDLPEDCPLFVAFRNGESYHNEEERLWRKDGTSFLADFTSSPIRDEQNELFGAVVLVKDTTLRHHAEAERQRFISELEHKNTELEQFTYTVSHDLKTPLVTIRGFIGYVKKAITMGNREQAEADLQRIDSAATKMQGLLNNLLEISRVGYSGEVFDDVNLHELAQEALELISSQRSRDSKVHIHISSALPVVRGDRIRLLELLQNLLENAFKFLGSQLAPSIEIDVRQNGNDRVMFVRDNGMGIDPAYQEKVFDVFERLDHHVPGTGVGLALAKRIVLLHHGRIWIESVGLGKGTTVCWTLN